MKKFENLLPRYRVMLVRESAETFTTYPKFQNSRDLFESFREEFAALERENFAMVTLDSKKRMIGYHTIGVGCLATSIVHPRLCVREHNRGRHSSLPCCWRTLRQLFSCTIIPLGTLRPR